MARRTTICALAAVMALCVVPQAQSRVQSGAEKYTVVWLAEVESKKAIEREAVLQRRSFGLPQACFLEPFSATLHFLPYSFDGRAPPCSSIAG